MFAFVKNSVAESNVGQKCDVCANIPIKNRIQFTSEFNYHKVSFGCERPGKKVVTIEKREKRDNKKEKGYIYIYLFATSN